MGKKVELITQADYARRRGVTRAAVTRAVKAGRITIFDDGLIDPVVADVQWQSNTRARVDSGRAATEVASAPLDGYGRPDGDPEKRDYFDYRAMREKAEAEMAQRANLKDAGVLVELETVKRGVFDVVRAARDTLMSVGQLAAPRCIGLADSRQIEHVISQETRRALEEFEVRLMGLAVARSKGGD